MQGQAMAVTAPLQVKAVTTPIQARTPGVAGSAGLRARGRTQEVPARHSRALPNFGIASRQGTRDPLALAAHPLGHCQTVLRQRCHNSLETGLTMAPSITTVTSIISISTPTPPFADDHHAYLLSRAMDHDVRRRD